MLVRAAAVAAAAVVAGTIVTSTLLMHTSMGIEADNVRESLWTILALKFRHRFWLHMTQHVIIEFRTEKETLVTLNAPKLASMDAMLKGMCLYISCITEHFAADTALVFRVSIGVFN